MADYFSQSVFQPKITKHLLTEEDVAFFEAFDITVDPGNIGSTAFNLYAEGYCTTAHIEVDGVETEMVEDDLYARFQEIIRRSNGELTWVSQETAYTCEEMRPDGFGGGAVFITADDVQNISTSGWLQERIGEAETGDIGPHTDGLPEYALYAMSRALEDDLNLRYEYARISLTITLKGEGERELHELLREVKEIGQSSFYSENDMLPAVFADVPILCNAWRAGWNQEYHFDLQAHLEG